MIESVPRSIIDIANKNQELLNRFNFDAGNLATDFNMSQLAGEQFMEDLYPGYKTNNQNFLHETTKEDNIDLVNAIIAHDIGMLLVRPEMYHHRLAVLDFLKERNFSVIYEETGKITPEAYASIYRHVFAMDSARLALPSRTALCVNSPAYVVIFKDPEKRFSQKGIYLASGFVNEFKGKPGIHSSNTLRGGVVYKEAIRLGFNTLENPTVALATDPFWMLRHMVKSSGDYYHVYLHLDNDKAFMAYNSEGVHTPNFQELPKDLVAMISKNQLNTIYNILVR